MELATLNKGEYIGEISIIDKRERSASAQAKQDSILYALSLEKLEKHQELYAKLLLNLSKVIAQRLRNSNLAATTALQKQLTMTKLQVSTGQFMRYVLAAMSLYLIGFRFLLSMLGNKAVIATLSIRVDIILALVILVIIKHSGYPLSNYGLNLNQWRRAIGESILYSLPILLLVALIKWFPWQIIGLRDLITFKEFISLWGATVSKNNFSNWVELAIGYLLFAPVVEFIARGCLQGSLERFLVTRYARIQAIIIASLLFSSLYSYLSPITPVIMLVLGCFWGWLYSRHKTIVGVSISHILIGLWMSLTGFSIHLI
jgi:CRP/FNR family cyclic AMP-dependent transcriptional regulator